jgi:hypothetical protein
LQTIVESPAKVNEYERLRKPIQEIINFTRTLDEKYREKCFEVLLNQYLSTHTDEVANIVMIDDKQNKVAETQNCSFELDYPLELKFFLQQNKISEGTINKLFIREKGRIRPIYKITEKRKATAQIQIALLTAFENALVAPSGAFEFPMRTVRQRCMDYNVYETDFTLNFKGRAGLFVNVDAEAVKITELGKAELANIIDCISTQ